MVSFGCVCMFAWSPLLTLQTWLDTTKIKGLPLFLGVMETLFTAFPVLPFLELPKVAVSTETISELQQP